MFSPKRIAGALGLCSLFSLGVACDDPAPEPKAEPVKAKPKAAPKLQGIASARAKSGLASKLRRARGIQKVKRPGPKKRKIHAKPVATVPVAPDDPAKGKFTLEQATKGLPPGNTILATIVTDKGKLECELYDDKAPISVANFVGLARGLRPFKDVDGKWVKRPAYDGTSFHRPIKGFMIQGGDAAGTGSGGKHRSPGYVIPDEIWEDAHHDKPGYLCMANRGPNTNGMQFFIMDGAALHLDGGYTILGKCGPATRIREIAEAPKGSVKMKVTVTRAKRDKSAAPAASSAAPSASAAAPAAPSAAPKAPAQ